MKIPNPLFSIAFLCFFLSSAVSAHFFSNISSIPHSLIPNSTWGAWNNFQNFLSCHSGQNVAGLHKLKSYLSSFGYFPSGLPYSNFTDDFDDVLESAIKTYQLNFNLDPTGVLDAQTLGHIVRPRCGVADIINGSSSMNSGKPSNSEQHFHTVAHYSFFPGRPRWPDGLTELTYAFFPDNRMSVSAKAVFRSAFNSWSEVTPLTFSETTSFSTADIRIGFFRGDHGDGVPFDGPLGTLAHAFSPPSGRFHLDGDENWVIDAASLNAAASNGAFDLESVAVHEIGHLLGLGHSSVEDSIMYPTLPSGARKVNLHRDDVTGIQELYGSNPNFSGTTALAPRGQPGQERDTSGGHGLGSGWDLAFIVAIGLFFVLL